MNNTIDFGRRTWWLAGRFRIDVRAFTVTGILLAITLAIAILGVLTGPGSIGPSDVLDVIQGTAKPSVEMVVIKWRLPRVIVAIGVGACLAVAGAVFQSLTNNPLGSPDVIGFQTGAYTGALIVMLVIGSTSTLWVSSAALLSGLVTAVIVFALSIRRGRSSPIRLIIVGIGVSAALASFNTWLLLRAEVEEALMASLWGAGTLSGSTWEKTIPAVSACAAFLIASSFLARPLNTLQTGVDTATALGQRVRLVQLSAVMIGIGLTAIATATTGPIAFIALAAPQIARRLTRQAEIPFAASAAVGATLLILADIIAQRIHGQTPLPVGLVTVSVGGLYFLWLLLRERNSR